MAGPLSGIKVVELGVWVAGPSCAAILADWGAEVIKIEPPEGDPFRGLYAGLLGIPMNPPFELDNRGKRSIALNLDVEDARYVAGDLIDAADVFVTNMRPRVLEKYGLTYHELRDTNPKLIYCNLTGYGPDTEDANRAAYDVGAFYARGGVAAGLTAPGQEPPLQRGGMGDHMTGANAAGAVAAALFHRERTGEGQRVAASLLRTGVYMMGWDTNTALRGMPVNTFDRRHTPNPLINSYQDANGKWFWLLLLQGDRHWPDLLKALDAAHLGEDARFATLLDRLQNTEAITNELDKVLATKTLAEWGPIFDRENVWWAPVNTVAEVISDPAAKAAGAFIEIPGPDGAPLRQVATPVDFYGTPVTPTTWAPELGQDTETILLEYGYDWDRISSLKELGAIP